ncbi:Peptidyl-prolyl cis-trans isomerase Mip [Galdieria sulphuraria]|uniref:peptidylprolyl isomerase n=1 Tax=Galdieria sulphuraria TaxID=130081 RepID=M2WYH7_GALSU|nr:peptidylprolyl isomerase [Galdieria sulphuraria]EME29115.1 peptidylprolyl isomerase [Galdieria sulphuraria]GJD12682.1 Peptidyl-prolyl cis-trans isomerase Mip [Galdieria sulphuraria]|eukprot:XP_005705635.1 peptidylprolyl isomerase [Galdieria sulphuraria]
MAYTIKVKTFNKQQFDVSVGESTNIYTVHSLQEKIAEVSGIVADRQTLLYKGQVLDPDAPLANYSVSDGVTINVVRRVGAKPSGNNSKNHSDVSSSSETVSEDKKRTEASSSSASVGLGTITEDTLSSYMKNLGMSSTFPNTDNQSQLSHLVQSLMGGAQSGSGDMGSMSEMLSSIWQTPAMQEYLNDPEKLEASRQAVKNNPFLQPWIQADPEFSKVLNDPERWKESMEAAKMMFSKTGGGMGLSSSDNMKHYNNSSGGGVGGGIAASSSSGMSTSKTIPSAAEASLFVGEAARKKLEAAQERVKRLPVDLKLLAQSYGHALGQSLINSGLGLDYEQVVQGIKMACTGQDFPMSLSEYERQMSLLQSVAQEFVSQVNWKEANQFFEEIANDTDIHVIESGKIVWESGETTPDTQAPAAHKDSNVMIILQGRLLDGRVFFSCPPADESGEVVHPLTLSLTNAPYALRKGIEGMREGEDRTLYVHPDASNGMNELFGDVLPPNALLIFDVELVSADISEMEDPGNLMSYPSGFGATSSSGLEWGEEDLD